MIAYLTTEEAADVLRISIRSLHELTRNSDIPFRKLPGRRRLLFLEDELRAWLDGAPLEVVELAQGGRIVRPTASAA